MPSRNTSQPAGPDHLRKEAQIALLHALQTKDPARRLFLLQIAQHFERLAERAERMMRAKIAP